MKYQSALRSLIYLEFILLPLFVAGQKSNPFQWLTGKWQIQRGNTTILESWQYLNDSTMTGTSILLKNGKDTIPQETLELSYRQGEWNYISKVNGQNNNQPIKFKLIYQSPQEFISENPTHDFPQRIAYRKMSDTLVLASIEGYNNGKYAKQNFNYSKAH